ncbi:MAG TPA: PAS domain S-box protein [Gaiellaceae bacterium]|nr:PAS domain S-box protein [Gaiellaceae bacterium]
MQRYEEFFEHAPVGYLITDQFGVVARANGAAARLFGLPAEQFVGKPFATFASGRDRSDLRDRLNEVSRASERVVWETWLTPPRGRSFRAELHVSASRSETPDLHWIVLDVTARASTEQELQLLTTELEERVRERTEALAEERARLAAVVENMPAGLIIVDHDGNTQLVNERAIEILGVPAEGKVSDWEREAYRTDGSRYDVEDYPLTRALQSNEVVANERMEVVTTGGSFKFVDAAAAPVLDTNGHTIGALALYQDVTTQEGQERAEREFVTNAAHQLQSPLAAIISAIDVLQAGAKEEPERDVFLAHIERETHRLARLAQALLVLARAQTGVEAPRDEVVPLAPLMSEVASSIRPAEGVEIEISCPDDLALITNRQLVEQALLNVVDNAAKYTKRGRISLSGQVVEGAIEIEVADTGAGIAADEQPQVFDRFYRGSTNGAPGFGLGFAIVRSAVEAVDGELELSSSEESGTTVRVRLPRAATMILA